MVDADDMCSVQQDVLIEGMADIAHVQILDRAVILRDRQIRHPHEQREICLMPAVHLACHAQNEPCTVIGAAHGAGVKGDRDLHIAALHMLDEIPAAVILCNIEHRECVIVIVVFLPGDQIIIAVGGCIEAAPDRELHVDQDTVGEREIIAVIFDQRFAARGIALYAHPAAADGLKRRGDRGCPAGIIVSVGVASAVSYAEEIRCFFCGSGRGRQCGKRKDGCAEHCVQAVCTFHGDSSFLCHGNGVRCVILHISSYIITYCTEKCNTRIKKQRS